jgi:hypothetical protein
MQLKMIQAVTILPISENHQAIAMITRSEVGSITQQTPFAGGEDQRNILLLGLDAQNNLPPHGLCRISKRHQSLRELSSA